MGRTTRSLILPTSYISTTSASATRVADACFKTGISSLIGQTEGVFFADYNYTPHSINYEVAMSMQGSTTASFFEMYYNSNNQLNVKSILQSIECIVSRHKIMLK